jgi:hypothetical protein
METSTMKKHAKFLIAGAIAMTVFSVNSMAMGRMPHNAQGGPVSGSAPPEHHEGGHGGPAGHGKSVPEIDATAGTSAIALMVGVLALMKERSRSRKTPKSEA